jgi:NAD(P)-dependent dehydrogenase (short-subunit alcohol dehydrogenase family)
MASILVTGTSKGIGMATALVLGRAGHTVFATMRTPQGAPELARTAAKEGLPIQVSVMDVDSDASVAEAIRGLRRRAAPSMSSSTTPGSSAEARPRRCRSPITGP